jgi:hypothetical protein
MVGRTAVLTDVLAELRRYLLRKRSEGTSEADRLKAYLQFTREDIHAAFWLAADTLITKESVHQPNSTAPLTQSRFLPMRATTSRWWSRPHDGRDVKGGGRGRYGRRR